MAHELASVTGKSVTEAVKDALAAELARIDQERATRRAGKIAAIEALVDSIRADLIAPLPTMAEFDAEHYDENGLPR